VIYLDTSVALAHLLAEDRQPPDSLWRETLVSSRLLEFELWTRLNARRLVRTHEEAARALTGRIAFLELVREVLDRALNAFPAQVRTLDALHLASLDFIRSQGRPIALASYDARMLAAARPLGIEIWPLE
jgi:predicted nucleic acid-binding protein